MKKLSLEIDSLEVQTFDPEALIRADAGTVRAYASERAADGCPPGSGIVNFCYTWDQYDAACVFSAGWAGAPCTPVCQTGEGVCHSVPETCVTGVRCETSVENCG